MGRLPTEEEIALVLKLAGTGFSEYVTLKQQIAAATVTELAEGMVLEFAVVGASPFTTSARVLGEGSLYDIDDIPIIFTLLQRNGFIWHLDIARADGDPIRRPVVYRKVIALGFGKGLSLVREN